MATVTINKNIDVDVDIDVDISDYLDECEPEELAKALAEHPRDQVLAALQKEKLLSIENDCSGMDDIDDLIRAFHAGDASSFGIALGNLFPNNRPNIIFGLCVHPMKVAA